MRPRLVSVSVFKRWGRWRVQCTSPGCQWWLRRVRFSTHDRAVSWAADHVGQHLPGSEVCS